MSFHDDELQYPVEVEEPDPAFARMLQQTIGGVEGEVRAFMQYLFQGMNQPPENERVRMLSTRRRWRNRVTSRCSGRRDADG